MSAYGKGFYSDGAGRIVVRELNTQEGKGGERKIG